MIKLVLGVLAGYGFIALIHTIRLVHRDSWRRAVDGRNALVDE